MVDNLDGLLSPYLRRRRLKAAIPHIRGVVLDYGCGIGLLCGALRAENYVGVDIDDRVLKHAKRCYPKARFYHVNQMSEFREEKFDSIVGLAVIEHLPDPVAFLSDCQSRLRDNGRIILTTPSPLLDWAHGLGARVGLFAKESHNEHQSLMGHEALKSVAETVDLQLCHYRRFLLGANQLAILAKRS